MTSTTHSQTVQQNTLYVSFRPAFLLPSVPKQGRTPPSADGPAEPARWENTPSDHCAGARWQPRPRGASPKVNRGGADLAVTSAAWSRGEKRKLPRGLRCLLQEWRRCFPSWTPPPPLRSAAGCREHRLAFGALCQAKSPLRAAAGAWPFPCRLDSPEVSFHTLLSGFWLTFWRAWAVLQLVTTDRKCSGRLIPHRASRQQQLTQVTFLNTLKFFSLEFLNQGVDRLFL